MADDCDVHQYRQQLVFEVPHHATVMSTELDVVTLVLVSCIEKLAAVLPSDVEAYERAGNTLLVIGNALFVITDERNGHQHDIDEKNRNYSDYATLDGVSDACG
eukprot:TRINITY_DN965_c0_g1_i1.p1 TRINITY_DN965_c0_g1~~TRINITY_DN965_c0_g1_i1.p1  ORF type:complete len:104 (+),score=8.04 TRINITY_DN965_c0_g1_i1:125-436(+)